jgi:ABC-type branched-subunit amino acid transport system ATPase component
VGPDMTTSKDLTALPVGTVVNRYRITAILGRGGFGITYRAQDTKLSREVAIKEYLPAPFAVRRDGTEVLPNSTESAEDFALGRQRFLEEGRTLAGLHRAPAIVQVHDFLEANGTAYIVMELVPGATLEARLKESGPLAAGEVERLIWPLLDGLERVHDTGFLHRDIKPANIIIGPKGEPTLIDFGASRAAMAARTASLTAVFTPGYAAVEQFTSARQGPWTDIYGLAATLYRAITGEGPPNAVERILEDSILPLTRRRPGRFSRDLLVGIDAGLAVRAGERPQSIAVWRSLLQGATAGDREDTVPLPSGGPASPARPSPSPPPTMLRIEGLWKSFAGFVATRDISFELKAGETHAVIGPNGAGKTTFFNLITGHLQPDRGSVSFEGRALVGLPPQKIVRLGIARSFQRINIYPRLTVFENVQVALIAHEHQQWNLFRPGRSLHRQETRELLELVGLAAEAQESAGELSYGKQKQLELAIALASKPRLLLLDEPTAGMSPQETGETIRSVRDIVKARGLTLLFTEHDMAVVFGIAERISVLHHGEIIASGEPDAVRSDPEVKRVYLGERGHG